MAAQKYYLPAFFEYHTGETVRDYSDAYYKKYVEKYLVGKGSEETQGFAYLDVMDRIVREPGFLYANDLLDILSMSNGEVSAELRSNIFSIVTNPAMMEWLDNPKGQFASVFQYEVIRNIESYDAFKGYAVIDANNKVLFVSKVSIIPDSFKTADEIFFQDGKVSMPVKQQGKTIGRFFAITGSAFNQYLNFENTGYAVSYVVTDSKGNVLQNHIQDQRIPWIQDKRYNGVFSGIQGGFRIVSRNFPDYHLILIYRAQSALFYVSRLLLYAIGLGLMVWLVYYIRKSAWNLFETQYKRPDINRLLTQSSEISREYAALNLRFQNSMLDMRSQEMDRLKTISEHLTYLHQSVRLLDEEIQ
ncbi:MAG: hypothetical protein OEV66_03070 [Spirochaetia bacterium]|nr:hypothetical protein [Spirochaetia bacterium]